MSLKIRHFLCLLPLAFSTAYGQIGGDHVFEFLNTAPSAKAMALGNTNITKGGDLSAVIYNPAILDSSYSGNASFNYASYLSDIKLGNFAYAQRIGKFTYAAGIQFISYGDFIATDASGNMSGSFTAAEYAYYVSGSRPLNPFFTFGATVKYIYSSLYQYKSSGLATDLSLLYTSASKQTNAGFIIRNAGAQLTTYDGGSRGTLPLDVQLMLSRKLEKAPLRWFITLQQLQQWDLSTPNNPDPVYKKSSISYYGTLAKGLLRHSVIAAELFPDKALNVRISYNVLRTYNLQYSDLNTLSDGLSFGFGLHIGSINLGYAHAVYHSPFSADYFTLTTDLRGFYHKSK